MDYDILNLRSWIDKDKINWGSLSLNPNAIHLLEKNVDKIYWDGLSKNPNAIHLLEQKLNKINNSICVFGGHLLGKINKIN